MPASLRLQVNAAPEGPAPITSTSTMSLFLPTGAVTLLR